MEGKKIFCVECKEKKRVFEVDVRICDMSPLFKEMLEEENIDDKQDQIIKLSKVREADFEKVLEFCVLCEYYSGQEYDRRMLLKPEALSYVELTEPEEKWKVAFFEMMTLDEIASLANTANYLNIPLLIDACCEVIAIHLRKATAKASENNPKLVEVSKEDDFHYRNQYAWAYNQSYQEEVEIQLAL